MREWTMTEEKCKRWTMTGWISHYATYKMCDVCREAPEQYFQKKMEYTVIRKGRGFVYACQDKLYRQVKKEGNVQNIKCRMEPCDRYV